MRCLPQVDEDCGIKRTQRLLDFYMWFEALESKEDKLVVISALCFDEAVLEMAGKFDGT